MKMLEGLDRIGTLNADSLVEVKSVELGGLWFD